MTPGRLWLFKSVVALGFLLGILLLGDTIYTFRYVVRPLVLDHVAGVAVQLISELENSARAAGVADLDDLASLVEVFRRAHPTLLTSIRVVDQQGELLAASTDAVDTPLPDPVRRAVLESRSHRIVETGAGPHGEQLTVAVPFRFQLPAERTERVPGEQPPGRPRFKIAVVTLPLEAAAAIFWTLRRALAITLVGAVALLVTMTVITLQLRRYVQAKQLEQQLAVARLVQRELVPHECPDCGGVEFAIEFLPAFDVGGDYGDIFRGPNGDIVLVLGDVAGKGLPAALLMGVIHGAVRAASAQWTGANEAELTSDLNALLCDRTARNRYATLFWGFLDTRTWRLRYVNAGHLPPLLARASATGSEPETSWLGEGGPVVGLLPDMPYVPGEVQLKPGDRLVMFSDGLSEATNATDVEFGLERIRAAVLSLLDQPPDALARGILEAARTFTGGRPFADDLTLLVVGSGRAEPV